MNEESRLIADLKQEIAHLKQAREEFHRARNQHNIARERVALLQAQLVRVRYGNMPFMERLPRIHSGRPQTEADRRKLAIYNRMIYLELLARKAESIEPIFNHTAPERSLAFKLGAELHKSYAAIRKTWEKGKRVPDSVLQL